MLKQQHELLRNVFFFFLFFFHLGSERVKFNSWASAYHDTSFSLLAKPFSFFYFSFRFYEMKYIFLLRRSVLWYLLPLDLLGSDEAHSRSTVCRCRRCDKLIVYFLAIFFSILAFVVVVDIVCLCHIGAFHPFFWLGFCLETNKRNTQKVNPICYTILYGNDGAVFTYVTR